LRRVPSYTVFLLDQIEMASAAPDVRIQQLRKDDISLVRNPKSSKYYLSTCGSRITHKTPTTEGWLRILHLLKIDITDYDKSRVLLGELDTHGSVVVKIGDTDEITHEYAVSLRLRRMKGFVKHICTFECADDFRTLPSRDRTTLCRGPGSSMKIILMPYFRLGSLASYAWSADNVHVLRSCLKQAVLSLISAFHTSGFIHNDFHAGNVVLKPTKSASLSYAIDGAGAIETVETHGMRTWIMDFEKSRFVDPVTPYETAMALNDFYFDLKRFFMLLEGTFRVLDWRTIQPVRQLLDQAHMRNERMSAATVHQLLERIDGISWQTF
jgi:hypothetical protein